MELYTGTSRLLRPCERGAACQLRGHRPAERPLGVRRTRGSENLDEVHRPDRAGERVKNLKKAHRRRLTTALGTEPTVQGDATHKTLTNDVTPVTMND